MLKVKIGVIGLTWERSKNRSWKSVLALISPTNVKITIGFGIDCSLLGCSEFVKFLIGVHTDSQSTLQFVNSERTESKSEIRLDLDSQPCARNNGVDRNWNFGCRLWVYGIGSVWHVLDWLICWGRWLKFIVLVSVIFAIWQFWSKFRICHKSKG